MLMCYYSSDAGHRGILRLSQLDLYPVNMLMMDDHHRELQRQVYYKQFNNIITTLMRFLCWEATEAAAAVD